MAEGVVHLALECSDDAGSVTKEQLVRDIEAALRQGVAGFHAVELHEPRPAVPARAQSFIPLQQIKHRGKGKSL